jgi:two-component system phosphate regulon sensor histidine kinase PhoR
MKRIFPVITILILLSLLGIIFFQFLWIKGSLESEEQKFYEHVSLATDQAANDLMEEKGNLMPMGRKNEALFPSEKMQLEIFKPTITQKYSSDDIRGIIRKAFDKQGLKKIPFEFAISPLSLIGEEVQSENFYNLFIDSVNNRMQVIQLESPEEAYPRGYHHRRF